MLRTCLKRSRAPTESKTAALSNQMNGFDKQISTQRQEDPNSKDRYLILAKNRPPQSNKVFNSVEAVGKCYIALETTLSRDTSAGDTMLATVQRAKDQFTDNIRVHTPLHSTINRYSPCAAAWLCA